MLRALDRLRTGAVRPGSSYLAFIIPPVVSAKGGGRLTGLGVWGREERKKGGIGEKDTGGKWRRYA